MARDALAQRRAAERLGIAELLAVERPFRRLDDRARSTRARLADLEMQHAFAGGGAGIGGAQHLHGVERRHRSALGDLEDHRPAPHSASRMARPLPRGSVCAWHDRGLRGSASAHQMALTRPRIPVSRRP